MAATGPPDPEVDREPVAMIFFFFLTAAKGSAYNFATREHVIMVGDTSTVC